MTTATLYQIHPLRLRRTRHDAANQVTAAAVRGRVVTARSWARVVEEIDRVMQSPAARTRAAWAKLIEDYAEVCRARM